MKLDFPCPFLSSRSINEKKILYQSKWLWLSPTWGDICTIIRLFGAFFLHIFTFSPPDSPCNSAFLSFNSNVFCSCLRRNSWSCCLVHFKKGFKGQDKFACHVKDPLSRYYPEFVNPFNCEPLNSLWTSKHLQKDAWGLEEIPWDINLALLLSQIQVITPLQVSTTGERSL